jgi:hypothetical protein
MAMASDIMKGGTSAGQAMAINGQISPTVTAAGTTISDAFDLVASINVITTAAASSGVQLPSAMVGDEIEILNLGANSVTVYPDSSSARINALTAGAGFLLAPNTAVKCRKFTTTRWIGNLSA